MIITQKRKFSNRRPKYKSQLNYKQNLLVELLSIKILIIIKIELIILEIYQSIYIMTINLGHFILT